MELNASPTANEHKNLAAANGLALVRVTIGAMFISVFLRTWEKASTDRVGMRV